MMVKTPCPSGRCCCSALVTASLLSPAKLMVLLGQSALGVGNWNVVSLSASHIAALRVTYDKKILLVDITGNLGMGCTKYYIHLMQNSLIHPPHISMKTSTGSTCSNTRQPVRRRPSPTAQIKTTPAHLFVVRKLVKQSSLFNRSPPTGPQVLEVGLCLLLAVRLCPARSEVFMCQ